jgi:tetratricopeptide (TPR) repeat protein
MRSFVSLGRSVGVVVCGVCLVVGRTSVAQDAALKVKEPADKKAYTTANNMSDPDQRVAALKQFIVDYPKSQRVGRAQNMILTVLLKNFPQRTEEIDQQAQVIVKAAHRGDDRKSTENDLAMQLADGGTDGVDLKRADKYAHDSISHTSEAEFDEAMTKQMAKYKITMSAKEMHTYYAERHSQALASVADVYQDEGKLDEAAALLSEAYTLDPNNDDVNSVMGRVALKRGKDAEALADFERASLVGSLKPRWRTKMVELYRAEHGGSDAAMASEMDAMYARIFPATFEPRKAAAVPVGHTVLLQLFTGSGCPPCVGGDLAVEGLLESDPRTELVALTFDLHIPEPDPLTNPDTVAEAALYGIAHTPSYVLDGASLPIYGADRSGSEKLYKQMAPLVDEEAASPSHVTLQISAVQRPDGVIAVKADVESGDESALREQIARKVDVTPPMDEGEKKAADEAKKNAKPAKKEKQKKPGTKPSAAPAVAAPPVAPPAPQLQLHIALVEDNIRYGGENGVRFHRMVVRALAKPADEGTKVVTGEDTKLEASFNPKEISEKWAVYLAKYEDENDRFGKIEFISKDTTMNPRHLAIAAWVQDATTHRVLQAALVPVEGSK